jgi:hypothetical protein
MKRTTLNCWLLIAGLLTTCHPAERVKSLPTARLLEVVPPGYRPVDQQDMLYSYWAPPATLASSLFQYTDAQRSEGQLRVQLVPASAVSHAQLDTLTFYPAHSRHGLGQGGLNWVFGLGPRYLTSALLNEQGKPAKVFTARTYPLVLTEERVSKNGYQYARNRYTIDYPFCPVAVAHLSDTVAYVQTYLLRANVPQADTLYANHDASAQQLPHEADQLDTTRLALLRISWRQLRHSADPAEGTKQGN